MIGHLAQACIRNAGLLHVRYVSTCDIAVFWMSIGHQRTRQENTKIMDDLINNHDNQQATLMAQVPSYQVQNDYDFARNTDMIARQ